MISIEKTQEYAYFSGMTENEIDNLAQLGEVARQKMGTYFFRDNEELMRLYLLFPLTDRQQIEGDANGDIGSVIEIGHKWAKCA